MDKKPSYIKFDEIPELWPTQRHDSEFWQHLGRCVATFGFLEEILGKAIFAFTATKTYPSEVETMKAYELWLPQLKRALTDSLQNLAEQYNKARREHSDRGDDKEREILFNHLIALIKVRNTLCHGSWRPPDANGKSKLHYVTKQLEIFESEIDIQFLRQVQTHTAELICAVITSVTIHGWNFPGGSGIGKPIT